MLLRAGRQIAARQISPQGEVHTYRQAVRAEACRLRPKKWRQAARSGRPDRDAKDALRVASQMEPANRTRKRWPPATNLPRLRSPAKQPHRPEALAPIVP